MKTLIVIPTLNESKNIKKLVYKILKNSKYKILVIDDNSNDGTINILKKLKKKFTNFNYKIRKKKKGLGSAHLDGISYGYKKKFNFCITLDADGTHNPKDIKKLLLLIKKENYDVINTSRFLNKNSLADWPYIRRLITIMRYLLVRFFLNTKFDSSSGFRCYNLNKIELKYFNKVRNKDFFFLIESLYILQKNKYKIKDIPITLKYREAGNSKMKPIHIIQSLFELLLLSIRKNF